MRLNFSRLVASFFVSRNTIFITIDNNSRTVKVG